MKNYKVLKKCKPFLIKGTVLESTLKRKFTGEGINILLMNKTIEEIQELEFTRDQLKEKCIRFTLFNTSFTYDNAEKRFDNWIKGKEQ